MTGYSTATARHEDASVTVTLKSVNHRFLDLHLRVPPEVDPLEPRIRQAMRARLSRGHVDVTVAVDRSGGVEVHFDRGLVRGYFQAFQQLREEMHLNIEPDLNALLKLPGAVTVMAEGNGEETDVLERLLFEALDKALTALDAMRAKEAVALAEELRTRNEGLQELAGRIDELRAGADKLILERLKQRMAELTGQSVAPERLAQEAAMLVERADVSEEIARLRSHVGQFREMLVGGEAKPEGAEVGKRLDFLLQEMNREANTILSKTSGVATGLEITDLAIRAKAEIEKLREQVQNLQ